MSCQVGLDALAENIIKIILFMYRRISSGWVGRVSEKHENILKRLLAFIQVLACLVRLGRTL